MKIVVFKWKRRNGYEVSSIGDSRFSAFNAIMPDGRSIECHYQCDIKGYDIGGTNWRLGKGKSPVLDKTQEQLWFEYLSLWRIWARHNLPLMRELYFNIINNPSFDNYLSDSFANTNINQAHALSVVLNELVKNGKPEC